MPRQQERTRPADCPWRRLIEWLNAGMALRGYKPVDLSTHSGIPISTLSGLLNCNHNPSLENQRKLARFFGVELSFIEMLTKPLPDVPLQATVVPGVTGIIMLPIVSEVSAGGGWSLEATKTESSDRRIPLVPLALDALARHRERLTFARRWERYVDQGLIFSNAHGNPVERTNLRGRSWAKLVKRAGLPPTRFHDLRHAAATFLLSEGVPVNVVQAVLGHSSASTTLNVYGHVLVGQTREALGRLGRLLEGGS